MERITTAEAARRLGVSQTQVRRMVRGGKLSAEWEHRPQGKRLVVLWTEPDHAPHTPHHAPEVATPDATEDVTPRADVGHLLAEIAWLRERLEKAEEERAELRRMVNLEQQTTANLQRMLPTPRATETPPHAPGVVSRTPLRTPPTRRRPRWVWLRVLDVLRGAETRF